MHRKRANRHRKSSRHVSSSENLMRKRINQYVNIPICPFYTRTDSENDCEYHVNGIEHRICFVVVWIALRLRNI